MSIEAITVAARDGNPLAADLHLPDGDPVAAALIAPAMGVPRRYYAAFAGYLARSGWAVVDALAWLRGAAGPAPAAARARA